MPLLRSMAVLNINRTREILWAVDGVVTISGRTDGAGQDNTLRPEWAEDNYSVIHDFTGLFSPLVRHHKSVRFHLYLDQFLVPVLNEHVECFPELCFVIVWNITHYFLIKLFSKSFVWPFFNVCPNHFSFFLTIFFHNSSYQPCDHKSCAILSASNRCWHCLL